VEDLFSLFILFLIIYAFYAIYRAGKREGSRKGYGVGYARGRRKGKSSCFVASAAFQDPNHPCVQILRRYRDDVLERTIAGRIVIGAYYLVGPYGAKVLEHRPRIRKVARRRLVAVAWSARCRLSHRTQRLHGGKHAN